MTRPRKNKADWETEAITLEPNALKAAKGERNALVVAGPGAGKTELLAQRASFLLETQLCPAPYRILAISFKREAAENLKKRVVLRCGRELASRFDSMTYDAFAKDILDRFRLSLHAAVRPSADYRILTGSDGSPAAMQQRLLELPSTICSLDEATRRSLTGAQLIFGMVSKSLPAKSWPDDPVFVAGASMWSSLLSDRPSSLSFQMIGRLAEFIINSNPQIRIALRSAYSFVFLDEFQDTTSIQFSLTKACFLGRSSVLTAVGDTKQKIMGWAGAMPGVFNEFKTSFDAEKLELTQNHRSRPKLVAIQSVFAKALDPEAAPVSVPNLNGNDGECRVFEFQDEQQEAAFLANLIDNTIKEKAVPPEEICVLCRARPDSFASALIEQLNTRKIKVLVEVNRREIVSEPISALLLDLIALMFFEADPEAWDRVSGVVAEIADSRQDPDNVHALLRLVTFLAEQKKKMPGPGATPEEVRQALSECLAFIGKERFAVLHPQYAQGDYLDTVIERLAEVISSELSSNSWSGIPDAVRGVNAVSIMTMHKSKGLEFHTVIFLGLEDNAIWNYQANADEETCGLFVALSRAKECCFFTFCQSRPGRWGNPTSQSHITIQRIFDLFAEAGVSVETVQQDNENVS